MLEEMSLDQIQRLLEVLDRIYEQRISFDAWYSALLGLDGYRFQSIESLEESLQTWEGNDDTLQG